MLQVPKATVPLCLLPPTLLQSSGKNQLVSLGHLGSKDTKIGSKEHSEHDLGSRIARDDFTTEPMHM